jgi:8-oxo-dGTP diphosphatase
LWEFPGGKLEAEETPAAALQRELREELDLPIEVGEIFDVIYHRYDWGAVLILAYHCTPHHFEVRNLQVATHRWLRPAELTTLPFLPADLPLIARLQQQFPA